MDQEMRAYMKEKTEEMLRAPSCYSGLKEAAQKWLSAAGTDEEESATEAYVKELQADIMSIDGLIAFAGSNGAKRYLGEEQAAKLLSHAKERKASGEKYCDCPACAPVEDMLKKLGKLA